MCSPRKGHLDAVYRIFRYLQKSLGKNPGKMAYDPMYEPTDENLFEVVGRDLYEWKYLYHDAQEIRLRHILEAIGKCVVIKAYVDYNHAGNMANRSSYSGIIIYVNDAPKICCIKLQNTVEASSFGSEFVALRIVTEIIEYLRYKLRCFGISVGGPAEVFCDNMSVVKIRLYPHQP